jgi:hypothetical protein
MKAHKNDYQIGQDVTLWIESRAWDQVTVQGMYLGIGGQQYYEEEDLDQPVHRFLIPDNSIVLLGHNCYLSCRELLDSQIQSLQYTMDHGYLGYSHGYYENIMSQLQALRHSEEGEASERRA